MLCLRGKILPRSVKTWEFSQRVSFRTGSEAGVGCQVRTLAGFGGISVAISTDGKRVVSGSDYDIEIWDMETGAKVRWGYVVGEGSWAVLGLGAISTQQVHHCPLHEPSRVVFLRPSTHLPTVDPREVLP